MSAPVSVYVSAEVSAVADLYGELVGPRIVGPPSDGSRSGSKRRASLSVTACGRPAHWSSFSNWHPDLAGSNDVAVWSAVLSENDFLGTVAREHGYRALEDVNSLADGRPDPDFERAVEAVLAGDTDEHGPAACDEARSGRSAIPLAPSGDPAALHRSQRGRDASSASAAQRCHGHHHPRGTGRRRERRRRHVRRWPDPVASPRDECAPGRRRRGGDARIALVTAGAWESFTP